MEESSYTKRCSRCRCMLHVSAIFTTSINSSNHQESYIVDKKFYVCDECNIVFDKCVTDFLMGPKKNEEQ
jgi:hypothetical protein